jgi:hypothetical protein
MSIREMDVRFKHTSRDRRFGSGRRGASHGAVNETGAAQRQPVPRSHRQGGALQDQALYNCSCGYVFNAAVSTSVGCPHCGGTQAW